jgi:hypothetical protein
MKTLPIAIAALIVLAIGGLIVFQRAGITRKGYELGAAEKELRGLREQNRIYGAELSRVTGIEELTKRVNEMKLDLAPPADPRLEKSLAKMKG